MIFSKIKNITLFEGKVGLKIKFWKNLTKLEIYFLNKIHFDILGVKCFSYIIPEVEENECKINQEKKALIEKSCRIFLKKNDNIKIYKGNPKLNYDSFTKTGKRIGRFDLALDFLNKNLILDEEYPDKIFGKYIDKKLVGYGCIQDPTIFFEIGDKIYNKNFVITRKDLTSKEYYEIKNEVINESKINYFFIDEKKIQDSLNELLPKRKGENDIKNLNESKISALNYAKKFEKGENFN